MKKDKELVPSTTKDGYWIWARGPQQILSDGKGTTNGGKWLIFVSRKDVDEVWEKIKEAVGAGTLGPSAKVSTAKPNPNSTDPKTHVICVYTLDWEDEKDVMRVREKLRNLGIVSKIPYKADIDTLEGKYGVRGDTRISKYYC